MFINHLYLSFDSKYLNMKKILVTGGLGFIGCNLVNYLISKNYFIINIDKSSYSSNKKYFINS